MNTSHYPSQLLRDYNLLLEYFPSHELCRPYVVQAIQTWKEAYALDSLNILEVGPGYGETTELILKDITCLITLVETDTVASQILLSNLHDYKDRITLVEEDATVWIQSVPSHTYDVFTASWVIHNFPMVEREAFLAEVARVLKPGGICVLFDKVLPDNEDEVARVWDIHKERLSGLDTLGRTELKEEMLSHEERDAKPPYVWYESQLMNLFRQLHFTETTILTRNERDIVVFSIKSA